MPKCPNCGSEVTENMAFCPKCGASLKAAQAPAAPAAPPAPAPMRRRDEKSEKGEKREKEEKGEKHEKHEHAWIGPLIGGIVLIFLGLMSYLEVMGYLKQGETGAIFLVLIGVLIIIAAMYYSTLARRRNP